MTLASVPETAALVDDGDEVYFGGFGFNQPFAAAHELIRRGVEDLRVVRASGDILLDQLVGAGCVRETVISHCWNAVGPTPTHAFRRAVEDGDPNPLAVEEYGLGDVVMRLFAGARGLPFVPAAPAEGTGQFEHRADEGKFTAVEFDGETHQVMSPLDPDIGFVHAHRVDERGNTQLRGPRAELRYGAMACDTLVVLAEEVVDTADVRDVPEHTVIPGFLVDHVVECPGGSHPSGVVGHYGRDVPYLQQYGEWTEHPDGFAGFLDRWVYGVEDREAYLDLLADEGFDGAGVLS